MLCAKFVWNCPCSSGEDVCLFVSLEFFFPPHNFSLIRRRHHCQWRAWSFDLCSTPMAIEQWGFFSMSQLLWHRTSVYNGHLRGPVSLTLNAKHIAVKLSLPVLTTWVCRGRDSNTQPSACRANALTHCPIAVEKIFKFRYFIIISLRTLCGPFSEQIWILITQGCFMQSLIELANRFWRRTKNSINVFSQFHNYLSLD